MSSPSHHDQLDKKRWTTRNLVDGAGGVTSRMYEGAAAAGGALREVTGRFGISTRERAVTAPCPTSSNLDEPSEASMASMTEASMASTSSRRGVGFKLRWADRPNTPPEVQSRLSGTGMPKVDHDLSHDLSDVTQDIAAATIAHEQLRERDSRRDHESYREDHEGGATGIDDQEDRKSEEEMAEEADDLEALAAVAERVEKDAQAMRVAVAARAEQALRRREEKEAARHHDDPESPKLRSSAPATMESAASSLGDYISAEESLGEQSEMGAPAGLTSPERI